MMKVVLHLEDTSTLELAPAADQNTAAVVTQMRDLLQTGGVIGGATPEGSFLMVPVRVVRYVELVELA